MELICRAAAEAPRRYAKKSGMERAKVPEAYIDSTVFDAPLGLTMELKPTVRELAKGNNDARRRLNLPAPEQEQADECLGQKPDLAVYDGQSPCKSEENLLLLIETKRWSFCERIGAMADRAKLLRILRRLDTCPAGAILVLADCAPDSEWLLEEAAKAKAAGDRWIALPVPPLEDDPGTYAICARVFRNPAYRGERGERDRSCSV